MGMSQPFCKKSSFFDHVINHFLDQACSIKMTGFVSHPTDLQLGESSTNAEDYSESNSLT